MGVTPPYLAREVARQRAEIARRAARFRSGREFPSLAGRTAIVVDDGVATGLTTRAALRAVRTASPALLVAAVPVAAPEAWPELRRKSDEVVCLYAPPDFFAVGLWYETFPQLSDEEAAAALEQARQAWERAQDERRRGA